MRRARGLTTQRRQDLSVLGGKPHFHTCADCQHTYRCSCRAPEVNGRCTACRQCPSCEHLELAGRCRGCLIRRERPLWDVNLDPQQCCRTNQLLFVNELDERLKYKLAGPGPWFRCETCFRHHGFVPKRSDRRGND